MRRLSKNIALALALVVCLAAVGAQSAQDGAPLELERVDLHTHRLPARVRPSHYELHFDFDDSLAWYTGAANITVNFVGPDSSRARRCFNRAARQFMRAGARQPGAVALECSREGAPDQIVLHADASVAILSAQVLWLDARWGHRARKPLRIRKILRDKAKQLLVLRLGADLPAAGSVGVIELTFEVVTRMDARGVYFEGQTAAAARSAAAPQTGGQLVGRFAPAFARLAMPCFDEPAFKAEFSLSFAHPDNLEAHAGAPLKARTPLPGGRALSVFERSAPLAAGALAFTLGEYDEPLKHDEPHRGRLQLRALAPRGRRAKAAAFALRVAALALERIEAFLDYELPLEKLDLVALTNADTDTSGAWGLVLVRDSLMLLGDGDDNENENENENKNNSNEDASDPESRVAAAVSVAYAVARHWLGGLVTADWWAEAWLTEGAAALLAMEIASELFGGQSDHLLRIGALSRALEADSARDGHAPLSPRDSALATSEQVCQLFGDGVHFMKSAALADLLRDALGRTEYRDTLRKLVRAHAFNNVSSSELLAAIAERSSARPRPPLEPLVSSWTVSSGYPVVSVALSRAENKLVLYEEPRCFAKAQISELNRPSSAWALPLEVLISDAAGERRETRTVHLGLALRQPVAGQLALPDWFAPGRGDWVKVAARASPAAYYRVRYARDLLAQLEAPVRLGRLAVADRLQLLNDARALAAGSLLSVDALGSMLDWFSGESEPVLVTELLYAASTHEKLAAAANPDDGGDYGAAVAGGRGLGDSCRWSIISRRDLL